MIEAFRDFLTICYEHTGQSVVEIKIDRRHYAQLCMECEDRWMPGVRAYPAHIELDGTIISAR
jgi:hypothetical protein